ncbi:metallo-beta-lactamase class B [Chryseobacterium defluvii]|uniref:beta-lactamase n=1 Tax=Chryseobacterium defluvii TaxID=160396 RepID=A0A840KFA6_9FLAO|nr:subclass B1 metallo-beta-lactamase [Chryseobacterium defluvii]MBB4806203.1 metallo-beta-lactamase class B [Chryseobacterium defluvii]
MKSVSKFLFLLSVLFILSCNSQKSAAGDGKILYQSDDLIITQLSKNVYQHISYFNSETFGKVPCNGMIVKDGNETVIFDTPVDDKSSGELISWIKNNLHSKINAVIPTHFHEDCVGGLKEFSKNKIPSYASNKTIGFAKEKGFNVPDHGFDDALTLNVGKQKVYATFYGEGHTKDNVVGYFPVENAMFGGCLIKEAGASKGNLEDANVNAWPATVEKVKKAYPEAKIIIPGHGKTGGTELLDYTIKLFRE